MTSTRIQVVWAITGAGLALAAVLYLANPETCVWLPPCFFHSLTGLHCPGCGSTRALHQLLHGNVAGAVRLNPLTVVAVAAWAAGGCWQPARQWAAKPWVAWLIVTIVVAFGIVRNIPMYPFTWLAP